MNSRDGVAVVFEILYKNKDQSNEHKNVQLTLFIQEGNDNDIHRFKEDCRKTLKEVVTFNTNKYMKDNQKRTKQ